MIRREDLPDDAADWTTVSISLDRLRSDREDSCPSSREEIMEYVRLESADTDDANDASLKFIRTAKIGDISCWLWSFQESDGEVCYVLFRKNGDGSTILGLASANSLSPEQYLLADYYDEVYWS